MIEIKSSDYKVVSQELIEADIAKYKAELNNWVNSEGVPKPYPSYSIVETIVKNDAEWTLIEDELLDDNTPSHDELIEVSNSNYNYIYARMYADDGYGTVEEQLEYIAENGVTAFKNRQMAVKARYPKNET